MFSTFSLFTLLIISSLLFFDIILYKNTFVWYIICLFHNLLNISIKWKQRCSDHWPDLGPMLPPKNLSICPTLWIHLLLSASVIICQINPEELPWRTIFRIDSVFQSSPTEEYLNKWYRTCSFSLVEVSICANWKEKEEYVNCFCERILNDFVKIKLSVGKRRQTGNCLFFIFWNLFVLVDLGGGSKCSFFEKVCDCVPEYQVERKQ